MMRKGISRFIEVVVERALMNKVVLYLDDDDDRRERVLKRASEVLNSLDVSAVYIDVSNIVRTCILTKNFTITSELSNIHARVLILNNFDTMLVIDKIRDSTLMFYRRCIERGITLVLGSGTDILQDRDIMLAINSLGHVHVINALTVEKKRKSSIYSSIKTIIRRFLGNGGEDDDDVIVVQ